MKTELVELLAEYLWHSELKQRNEKDIPTWDEVSEKWKETYRKDAQNIIILINSNMWHHVSPIINNLAVMIKQ